jgi:ribonuclease HI
MHWSQFLRSRVIHGSKHISYHIFSSIWSSIKHKFEEVSKNSVWQLGNGENIRFWLDSWCGVPLVTALSIPAHLHHLLQSTVDNFIVNFKWSIPLCILNAYPQLQSFLDNVTIPLVPEDDNLYWKQSPDGCLSLKDAYSLHCSPPQSMPWAKLIWNHSIPPAKSLLVWRCLHAKLPTDDNLALRGCYLPSMCSLCGEQSETSFHLFLDCRFATRIWSWLSSLLNIPCNFATFYDVFSLCNRSWSPLCKISIIAVIINCFNIIWFSRNQKRFADKNVLISSAINMIIANVALSGKLSKAHAFSSVSEFMILRSLHVPLKFSNAPIIKEVLWQPPILNWIKCNSDGASAGNPGNSACGGVFRNSQAIFCGAFAVNLGIQSSLFAELLGAMLAIEIAHQTGWKSLWLETDSMLVLGAFKSPSTVPCILRNRWNNCLLLISRMNFFVSHIFREGNKCADIMANIGLSLPISTTHSWWSSPPPSLFSDLDSNRLGWPCFRFC